ncbi:S66 family peptidase [Pediococcus pentosaceus]
MTTIGFCSTSTPITAISPKRFERAKAFLKNKGIRLVAGSLSGKRDYYRSGSILDRANEVNQLIHNDEVDIIMATIGGTNTNAVLPYLDYEYLNQHPKTIVGYSDATALLLAVRTQAPNCRTLYGPALVASLGEWPPLVNESWTNFEKIIRTRPGEAVTVRAPEYWDDEAINWNDFERPKKQRPNQWHAIGETRLSGRLIGGNLNTIYGILASKYFPKLTFGDLLFIEDAEKDAATVEKNFAMIRDAGAFDKVRGVILGKHALFDDLGTQRRPIDILLEVLNNQRLSIIYDYDSCHTTPMMTTPLGAQAVIDAEKCTASFSDF